MPINRKKVTLLRNTLGNPTCFRNHFVAGDGHHDMDDILELVKEGYMKEINPPSFLGEGQRVFIVTEKGKLEALFNWEQ